MKKIAVFLDRDGTINKDKGYICQYSDIEIFPFAVPAVKEIKRRGFKVLVVTNQGSIAKAICTVEQVLDIHEQMDDYFRSRGASIDEFYFNPYHEEGILPQFSIKHPWRKPEPGMLLQGALEFDIDLEKSYMVGDSARDIIAGKRAGCKTILVLTGHGVRAVKELTDQNASPDFIAPTLWDALEFIE